MSDNIQKPLWLVKMQQEQRQQQQQSQAGEGYKPRLQFPIKWKNEAESFDAWRARTGGAEGSSRGGKE